MRSKLAGLIGIFATTLAIAVGVTVSSVDAGQPSGYRVVADDRGPGMPSPGPTP